MNKKFKFFSLSVFAILAFETAYLWYKEAVSDYEVKSNFVKLTKFSDFAFSHGYARHTFLGEIGEIFGFHPSYRESEISSFLMPGLGKAHE